MTYFQEIDKTLFVIAQTNLPLFGLQGVIVPVYWRVLYITEPWDLLVKNISYLSPPPPFFLNPSVLFICYRVEYLECHLLLKHCVRAYVSLCVHKQPKNRC